MPSIIVSGRGVPRISRSLSSSTSGKRLSISPCESATTTSAAPASNAAPAAALTSSLIHLRTASRSGPSSRVRVTQATPSISAEI